MNLRLASSASDPAGAALFARLGIVAMAAQYGFEPVASEPLADLADEQSVKLIPGARINGTGEIIVSRRHTTAAMADLLRSDEDAPLIAEYARIKALFESVCGSANLTELSAGHLSPDERILKIRNFAEKASVQVHLSLSDEPLKGGMLFVNIQRDRSR